MRGSARTVKSISIVVSILALLLLTRALPMGPLRDGLESWIADLGIVGPLVFALIYAIATVLLLPGSVLTLAAGAIFGIWEGFLTVSIGSNLGAAAAFLIARYGARRKVEQVAASRPKFRAIDQAISEGGWKVVALLRLSPAIPFNLQNYLYGLTNIRFWTCVLTSWLAMIPGTFMYVYLGNVAGQAAGDRQRTAGEWALLIAGLVATVVVTVYITRLAKRKLAQQSLGGELEATPATPEPARPTRVVGYVILAVLLLALALLAQLKSEALARSLQHMIGSASPTVDSVPEQARGSASRHEPLTPADR